MLGRLFHYGVDLALLSTALAGVKRNTGFSPKIEDLPEGTAQTVAGQYLGIGETIFDMLSSYSYSSAYFARGQPPNEPGRR